jgi:hypothetical protein
MSEDNVPRDLDVNVGESFRRKAGLVADGHKTKTPAALTHDSSVASRDSVRVALMIAALTVSRQIADNGRG